MLSVCSLIFNSYHYDSRFAIILYFCSFCRSHVHIFHLTPIRDNCHSLLDKVFFVSYEWNSSIHCFSCFVSTRSLGVYSRSTFHCSKSLFESLKFSSELFPSTSHCSDSCTICPKLRQTDTRTALFRFLLFNLSCV